MLEGGTCWHPHQPIKPGTDSIRAATLLFNVPCTLYSGYCTLFTVHCIMYTVHYTMYTQSVPHTPHQAQLRTLTNVEQLMFCAVTLTLYHGWYFLETWVEITVSIEHWFCYTAKQCNKTHIPYNWINCRAEERKERRQDEQLDKPMYKTTLQDQG